MQDIIDHNFELYTIVTKKKNNNISRNDSLSFFDILRINDEIFNFIKSSRNSLPIL